MICFCVCLASEDFLHLIFIFYLITLWIVHKSLHSSCTCEMSKKKERKIMHYIIWLKVPWICQWDWLFFFFKRQSLWKFSSPFKEILRLNYFWYWCSLLLFFFFLHDSFIIMIISFLSIYVHIYVSGVEKSSEISSSQAFVFQIDSILHLTRITSPPSTLMWFIRIYWPHVFKISLRTKVS